MLSSCVHSIVDLLFDVKFMNKINRFLLDSVNRRYFFRVLSRNSNSLFYVDQKWFLERIVLQFRYGATITTVWIQFVLLMNRQIFTFFYLDVAGIKIPTLIPIIGMHLLNTRILSTLFFRCVQIIYQLFCSSTRVNFREWSSFWSRPYSLLINTYDKINLTASLNRVENNYDDAKILFDLLYY